MAWFNMTSQKSKVQLAHLRNVSTGFKMALLTPKSGIHILPNISTGKDNKRMKFGQLIDSMRNIFLKKSNTIYGGETIPLKCHMHNVPGSIA